MNEKPSNNCNAVGYNHSVINSLCIIKAAFLHDRNLPLSKLLTLLDCLPAGLLHQGVYVALLDSRVHFSSKYVLTRDKFLRSAYFITILCLPVNSSHLVNSFVSAAGSWQQYEW